MADIVHGVHTRGNLIGVTNEDKERYCQSYGAQTYPKMYKYSVTLSVVILFPCEARFINFSGPRPEHSEVLRVGGLRVDRCRAMESRIDYIYIYIYIPYYMKFWRHFNLAILAIFQKIVKLKCTKIKCR